VTSDEHKKLTAVRASLRGTRLFCFEKNGTYLLYREVLDGPNTKVLTRKSIDDFVRAVNKALEPAK
jgi:hypothetical protein